MLLFLLLAGFSYMLHAQQYSRVKIDLSDHTIIDLANLGLDVEHGQYAAHRSFTGDFSADEISLMQSHDFTVTVLIPDVKQYYVQQNQTPGTYKKAGNCGTTTIDYATPQNFSLGSMGGFLTYQELMDNLDSMAAKYPNLITARQVIDSNTMTWDGHYIYWMRMSDNPNTDENEPEALFTALHHAREPASMQQVVFFMWYMLENYDTDPEIKYLVDNTELYFIPCVNPDGYLFNESTDPNGGGLWRKNRRNNGGSMGVDLNRNYSYKWGYDNTGSSPSANNETYRGPSAASEPEIQDMQNFVNSRHIEITLNYHTYGNLLIHPWGYSDQNTVDSVTFRAFAKYMTRYNHYVTGTGTETVGYVTNGDSDDWGYGDTSSRPAIFSMTPEAGDGSYGFWPPSSAIEDICKENMHQNLAVPRLLLNFGEVEDKTPLFFTDTNSYVFFNLQRLGLTAGDLTVSVTPVSSNIMAVGNSQIYTLNQFEGVEDSISISLDPAIADGDAVVYLLNLSNGINTYTDTLTKSYGVQTPAFTDAANNMSNWQVSGNGTWVSTTNDYYSPPSSFTESPNGDYNDNTNSVLTLNTPIDLSDTSLVTATLSFWAKWDIEPSYDFAEVLASVTGSSFSPLCGTYTKPGSSNQDPNEPIYDGTQSDWVQEHMDLSDYIGGQVYIRFRMVSDNYVTGDGFSFDDLEVNKVFEDTTGTEDSTGQTGIYDLALQEVLVYPNPATQSVTIEVNADLAGQSQLVVLNALGERVYTHAVEQTRSAVDVAAWPAGLYFYHLVTANGQTENRKLLILHP